MYYFLLFILVTAICIYYFLYKNKNYSKDNSELDNRGYLQESPRLYTKEDLFFNMNNIFYF